MLLLPTINCPWERGKFALAFYSRDYDNAFRILCEKPSSLVIFFKSAIEDTRWLLRDDNTIKFFDRVISILASKQPRLSFQEDEVQIIVKMAEMAFNRNDQFSQKFNFLLERVNFRFSDDSSISVNKFVLMQLPYYQKLSASGMKESTAPEHLVLSEDEFETKFLCTYLCGKDIEQEYNLANIAMCSPETCVILQDNCLNKWGLPKLSQLITRIAVTKLLNPSPKINAELLPFRSKTEEFAPVKAEKKEIFSEKEAEVQVGLALLLAWKARSWVFIDNCIRLINPSIEDNSLKIKFSPTEKFINVIISLNLLNAGKIIDANAVAVCKLLSDYMIPTKLSFSSNEELTDDILADLLNPFPTLHTLDLGYCPNITDKGLESLENSFSLKELDLSGCRKITVNGLKKLPQNLLKLRLDFNKQFDSHLEDGSWNAIPISVKQLILNFCEISDEELLNLKLLKSWEIRFHTEYSGVFALHFFRAE